MKAKKLQMDKIVSEMLMAIAHPNRLRIINTIKENKTQCACELLPKLGLEQSNLSRHLTTLVNAGVLVAWKDGTRMNYKIADEKIYKIVDFASQIIKERLDGMLKIE